LEPLPATIAGRFNLWLGREERAGRTYTEAQRAWLFAIRDFIAVNVDITPEDLMDAPDFAAQGGSSAPTPSSVTASARCSTNCRRCWSHEPGRVVCGGA